MVRTASQILKAREKTKVLAAVRQDGWALEHASEELRADRDVVLAAVQQEGDALEYASDELAADRDVVLAAVQHYGRAIRYASPDFFEEVFLGYLAWKWLADRPIALLDAPLSEPLWWHNLTELRPAHVYHQLKKLQYQQRVIAHSSLFLSADVYHGAFACPHGKNISARLPNWRKCHFAKHDAGTPRPSRRVSTCMLLNSSCTHTYSSLLYFH